MAKCKALTGSAVKRLTAEHVNKSISSATYQKSEVPNLGQYSYHSKRTLNTDYTLVSNVVITQVARVG